MACNLQPTGEYGHRSFFIAWPKHVPLSSPHVPPMAPIALRIALPIAQPIAQIDPTERKTVVVKGKRRLLLLPARAASSVSMPNSTSVGN